MKKIYTTALLLASSLASFAQISETDKLKNSLTVENKDTVAWLQSGLIQLGINQGFAHNWSAGGEIASLAINGTFNGNITRLYHNQIWSNTLEAGYGLMYAYSTNFVPTKVNDKFDFTSKYGSKIKRNPNLYWTGLFDFTSQFTKGYNYSLPNWDINAAANTSNFLSPAYLTLAAGVEYRKGTELSLFFSPLSLRMIFANSKYTMLAPEGAFGIPYGKSSALQLGAYFSGRYQHALSPNVMYKTRLDFYSNYLAKNTKDALGNIISKDNLGNIDIFWDNFIAIKLGKFLNLNFGFTTVYDNDQPYSTTYIDPITHLAVDKNEPASGLGWWQIKEVMTFGFAYKIH